MADWVSEGAAITDGSGSTALITYDYSNPFGGVAIQNDPDSANDVFIRLRTAPTPNASPPVYLYRLPPGDSWPGQVGGVPVQGSVFVNCATGGTANIVHTVAPTKGRHQ